MANEKERRKTEKRGRKPGTKNAPKAPVPALPEPSGAVPGRPDPPPELGEVALLAWFSLCDDLAEQRTLDRTDRKLMEAYCRLYATFRRIEKQLAEEPLTSPGGLGRTFINPLISCQADYGNKLRQH